jgi:hypothetical protein
LTDIRNETIILDAEHLTPEVIGQLKNNRNKLVAVDINDNSCFCYSYYGSERILDVDLIFKVAGIQKNPLSMNTTVKYDLSFGSTTMKFMDDQNWEIYSAMKAENRIHSLPYVLWENFDVPNIPFNRRKNLALVRGGHHYLRVLLLFNLIKYGLVDDNSVFNTNGYIGQFCPNCADIFRNGRMTMDLIRNMTSDCRLPFERTQGFFQDRGDWNNGCPSKYFELAELLGINRRMVENALNGSYLQITDFYDLLNKYTMYSDMKWIFSIYAPPRFWEAACAHTVNHVPCRTADQDYFPEMKAGEHYITYAESFADLEASVDLSQKDYKRIADNAFDLYDKWIKAGQYKLSTNLMDHILDTIESV